MYRKRLPLIWGSFLLIFLLGAVLVVGMPGSRKPAHAVGTSDNWPIYLYDMRHSGFNRAENIITPSSAGSLGLLWSINEGSTISTQPVIANGMVYWGSWDGLEHATYLNGTPAWTANLGTAPTNCGPSLGILSTATVTPVTINGTVTSVVFVGSANDQLYALNALTGAIIWQTLLGTPTDQVIWSSPTFYKGSVYIAIASNDCPLVQGQVIQLNAGTGAIQNTFNVVPNGCVGAGVWGSVTIDTSNGTLYFVTGNGGGCSQAETNADAIVQLNASNLTFMNSWQVPPAQQDGDLDFGSTPTLFTATIGGKVHRLLGVASKNGIYYAFDEANISTGPVWTVTVAVGGDAPQLGDGSISPSAWDGTNLYVGGGNTTIGGTGCTAGLRALNPATGAIAWERCGEDGPIIGAVTAVPGVVAVGEGNALWLVATSDGHDLFKIHDTSTNSQYYEGPTVANGILYIGNKDGELYAYRPQPGTIIAQDTFQRPNQVHWGTASDGDTWSGAAHSQSAFSIFNNTGQVSNGSGTYYATLGPTATDAEVLFSGSQSSFGKTNLGAVLRWIDTKDWYKAYFDGSKLVVGKRVNGTSTILGTAPFSATAGTSYTLRFRVVGSTLYAKIWQTGNTEPVNWILTITDSSLISGFCGLSMRMLSGVTDSVTSFLATIV
jgi:outer membrane protein assembly factor BamB